MEVINSNKLTSLLELIFFNKRCHIFLIFGDGLNYSVTVLAIEIESKKIMHMIF